jgi:16S rRNA (cytosine967-C5)-methyltransferase
LSKDPREIAARVLLRRERASEYIEDLVAPELANPRLAPADRGLLQELTYGVARWQTTLDWLIQRKTTAGRNQKPAIQILLRLALYQLFWLERIPDHAAVHQTVELAKQLGFGPQAGFINAVLRSYLRERQETERLLRELKNEQPALACSHPDWLFERWEKRWGRESAVRLMEWNNQPAKTFARVNTLRASAQGLREVWAGEGVTFEPVRKEWIPEETIFELTLHPRFTDLPSFQQGLFYIQDPSTLLAPHELAPEAGESILDLCAAPGGKTTYIAQLMGDKGQIVAQDLFPDRLRLVEANCTRLGLKSIQTTLTIAEPASAPKAFHRVLLDAPCSNTGVMRRRVDLRWRVRPEELDRLQRSQRDLLAQAADRVEPGGVLVYSTCSLEPEENEQIIRGFLAEHAEFRLERERSLLPFADGVDGAYVARLLRGQ